MEKLYKLKDALMDSLDEFDSVKGGRLKMGELEALNYVTDTIKNIDKICMLEEEGYSQDGGYGRDGGNSYANRRRDGRGCYSCDGGDRGCGMGRFYGSGREEMMEHIYVMEESADNERDREMVRCVREQLERGGQRGGRPVRFEIREVNGEIAELERSELTEKGVCTLSALYHIRDELMGRHSVAPAAPETPAIYKAAPSPARTLGEYGNSDFLQTVAGKDVSSFMTIMDNLMNSLRKSNVKQYNIVMERLSRL